MELPKFEHFNAFETENADVGIQRYELMCEFAKWDDVQSTRAFTCFIDNYALAWYMLLVAEDKNSKEKLFRKFKERFGRNGIKKIGSKPQPVEVISAIKNKPEPQIQPSDGKCDTYFHSYEDFENAHFYVPPVNVLNFISRQQKRPQNKRLQKRKFNIYQSSAKFHPSHNSNKAMQSRNSQSKQHIVNLFANTGCSRTDCKINVRIDSSVIHTLVDTGVAVSIINTNIYKALQVDKLYPVDNSDLLGVRGVNDNFIRKLGKVTLPVEIGKLALFHDFYILDDVNMPLILGLDFMHDQTAEISFPKQVLSLQDGMTDVSLSQGKDRDGTNNFVRTLSDVTFQPRQRVIFPVKIDNFSESTSLVDKHNIMGARRGKSSSTISIPYYSENKGRNKRTSERNGGTRYYSEQPHFTRSKPYGEKRVCVDYRKLNRLTKIYTQSLPNLSDVLDTLGEKQAQTYTVCDMRQGFWQLELDEESKENTAFMTHRGQYEFNRLPYGLAKSPATFNMIMNEIIRDLN
ncbi:unnamed protein product [Mytilus coruscus]|uniref:Reverse transcriptase domain-containing protein n=1 Tax=Mytilus coruscus TaxID=42192 RepID=A0A6J8EN43_MYTCO|nr:unnamed protein product [Mytilus coruscus]